LTPSIRLKLIRAHTLARLAKQVRRKEPFGKRQVLIVEDQTPLSTFPVCRLRVLCSMKEKAGRAEDRMTPATAFHMILAQLNPAVGAFLAGRS